MKWFVLILVACAGFAAYRLHVDRLNNTKEQAIEQGFEEGRRSERLRQAEEEARLATKSRMAITTTVFPAIQAVQSPLQIDQPYDFVPMIEIIKQRALTSHASPDPGQNQVYQKATALFDYVIAVAEERTKLLESMLYNRITSASSFSRPTDANSSEFFNRNVARRWEETLGKVRPVVSKLFEELRAAELAWNSRLKANAPLEIIDIAALTPPLISNDPGPTSSLNGTKASPSSSRVWRRSYYTTYGYGTSIR